MMRPPHTKRCALFCSDTIGVGSYPCSWKHAHPSRCVQGFGYHHALNPDPYRGAFGDDGPRYAADVVDLISAATPGRVAGFVAETIQGVGGTVPLATGYLPAVYKVWGDSARAGSVLWNGTTNLSNAFACSKSEKHDSAQTHVCTKIWSWLCARHTTPSRLLELIRYP